MRILAIQNKDDFFFASEHASVGLQSPPYLGPEALTTSLPLSNFLLCDPRRTRLTYSPCNTHARRRTGKKGPSCGFFFWSTQREWRETDPCLGPGKFQPWDEPFVARPASAISSFVLSLKAPHLALPKRHSAKRAQIVRGCNLLFE